MNQFNTLLLDSIRLLRARVLFWISLAVSAVAAVVYLSIGFDDSGMTLIFGTVDGVIPEATPGSLLAGVIYLGIFRKLIIGIWLTWVAMILALISYSPVFPEFMQEGAAGVTLSKPISRAKLFFYKFLGGLLFMAAQLCVFMAIVLIAVKWRLGVWNFSILLAVPVVLLVFSYLLAVMIWFGIKTKSVMASVLLTLLFWFFCFLAQLAENFTYSSANSEFSSMTGSPQTEDSRAKWQSIHALVRIPYLVLPKPGATTELLDRWITVNGSHTLGESTTRMIAENAELSREATQEMVAEQERHSPGLVIGSSVAFTVLVLALGLRAFHRRDF